MMTQYLLAAAALFTLVGFGVAFMQWSQINRLYADLENAEHEIKKLRAKLDDFLAVHEPSEFQEQQSPSGTSPRPRKRRLDLGDDDTP